MFLGGNKYLDQVGSTSSAQRSSKKEQVPSEAELERQQILQEMRKRTSLLNDNSWIRQRSSSVTKEPICLPGIMRRCGTFQTLFPLLCSEADIWFLDRLVTVDRRDVIISCLRKWSGEREVQRASLGTCYRARIERHTYACHFVSIIWLTLGKMLWGRDSDSLFLYRETVAQAGIHVDKTTWLIGCKARYGTLKCNSSPWMSFLGCWSEKEN